jgi:hypothetical protein
MAFFGNLLEAIRRKPTEYTDAMPRKKRVLEDLPVAPPLPPREPTAAELEQQAQNDAKLREYLKFRLGPILQDLKRRFKRFSKPMNVGLLVQVSVLWLIPVDRMAKRSKSSDPPKRTL